MDPLLKEVYDYFATEPPEDAIHLISDEMKREPGMHVFTEIPPPIKMKCHDTPTILVCGDSHDLCSCNELATKEVTYERTYDGMTNRFRESICTECFESVDYLAKLSSVNVIKINEI